MQLVKTTLARKSTKPTKWQSAYQSMIYIAVIGPYMPNKTIEQICAFGNLVSRFNCYETRHIRNYRAIAVSERELRRTFGKDWQSIIGHLVIRGEKYSYGSRERTTREFSVVPYLAEAVNDAFRRPKEQYRAGDYPITRTDGKRKTKRTSAVVTRDGRKPHGDLYNISATIKINTENVATAEGVYSDWLDAVEGGTLPTLAPTMYANTKAKHERKHAGVNSDQVAYLWLIKLRALLNRAQAIQQVTDEIGFFHQTFEQRNGKPRFTGTGTSLQSSNKDLRHAALAGCWQYDIECCHHQIMLMYAKMGCIKCPELQKMVDNRTKYRNYLAGVLGHSDTDAVKKALLIIVYGGRFQWSTSTTEEGALLELLGMDGQLKLEADERFKALRKEIDRVSKFIVEHHQPKNGHKGQIKNALSQLLPTKYLDEHGKARKVKRAQKVAFILQGIESQAMQAMLKAAPSAVLPIHDAIITRDQVNIPDLIAAMKAATGIEFTVEEKQIKAPDWT